MTFSGSDQNCFVDLIYQKTLSLKLVEIVYLMQINKWLPVSNDKRVGFILNKTSYWGFLDNFQILHRSTINSMWMGDSIFVSGRNFTSERSARHKLNIPVTCKNKPITYFIKKVFIKTSQISCCKPKMKLQFPETRISLSHAGVKFWSKILNGLASSDSHWEQVKFRQNKWTRIVLTCGRDRKVR